MISPVELRRILAEWQLRVQRVKDILQPPAWDEKEWRQFSQALALMVRDHGRSWIIDPNVYWDLRWRLQDGAELVCQIEHVPGERTSLVVAQNGGFAAEVGSYTWLWAEFNMEGNFSRDPYWVEGTWKEALTTLLLPLDRQASYMLAGRAQTPDSLLLQEGARPNDHNYLSLMPGLEESRDEQESDFRQEKAAEVPTESPVVPDTASANGITEPASTAPPDQVLEKENASPVAEPEPVHAGTNGKSTNGASPRIDTPAPIAIRWGMAYQLTWKDSDDIAYALIDKYPEQDPLKLSFPKLQKMIIELEDFKDDPEKSSESILETIQMAWYEEVK